VSDSFEYQDSLSQTENDVKRWGPILGNPTPGARLLDFPTLPGLIKQREEDFLVDEIPLYEPSGSGEHVYVRVQKHGMSHSELLGVLRKHFKVRESAIGAAGMKDRIAVTSQTLSIHMPDREPTQKPIDDERIEILWMSRHANKLRRGHLEGNRFVIRIRNLDPSQAPQLWRGMRELEKRGIPNYYGHQRFGYRRNTQRLGAYLLQNRSKDIVEDVLGTQGSWFPAHQRNQRDLFDEGKLKNAMQMWGRRDEAEKSIIAKLVSNRPPDVAVKAVSRHMRGFWVSAVQSAIFNHALDARVRDGSSDQILEGDIAFRHQSRKGFLVDKGTMGAEDQQARVQNFEISPAGPIWGEGMLHAGGQVADRELVFLREAGIDEEMFTKIGLGVKGTRRPYRVQMTNTGIDSGFDDHGPYIRITLDLPRGSYATFVLRELLGDDGVDSARRDHRDSGVYGGADNS